MFNFPVMMYQASLWLSAIILLVLFGNTWAFFIRNRGVGTDTLPSFLLIIITLITSAFGLTHFLLPEIQGQRLGLDVSFLTTLAVVSWIILLIILIGSRWWALQQVGLIVYPIAAICFVLASFHHDQRIVDIDKIWPLEAHIWLSLTAYGLLTIAAIQAIFVIKKQQSLKKHNNNAFISTLPALSTLEQTLFRLTAISHVWLTLALITGFLFLEDVFSQNIAHKTILSCLSWLLLSVFLIGHKSQGWRGSAAARWVLFAFMLVLIGFAGSKFIYDHIL